MFELRYPLFDGETLWDGAAVTVENGMIASVTHCDPSECGDGLLMPGFIDAHTHIENANHANHLLRSGITTACDVSAPQSLVASSRQLTIVSSAGMAMGLIMNPKGYVAQAAANGAKYIKVLLFNSLSIGKTALCGIVKAAHEAGLKVAVHATEPATVKQAVAAEADILLHVPMKEPYSVELARSIAEKGIAVAPTLVMMKTFAQSKQNGYKPTDYQNAENAVKLLHDCGVSILAATDANPGSFAPAVEYGSSFHSELELLAKAGLEPLEVLTAATSQNAKAFGLTTGRIIVGQPATMLLVGGRPDQNIADCHTLRTIWVKGEELK